MRYVSRIVEDKGETGESAHVVVCEDDEPVNTGLVDSSGVPIYRVRNRFPMGFRGRKA